MHIIYIHTCNMHTPSMTNMRIIKSHPQENNHGIHFNWSVSAKVCRAQKPEITDLMPVNLSSVVWRSLLLSSRWYLCTLKSLWAPCLRSWPHIHCIQPWWSLPQLKYLGTPDNKDSSLNSKPHSFPHRLLTWAPCHTVLTGGTEASVLSSQLHSFPSDHQVALCLQVEQRLPCSVPVFLLTTRWHCVYRWNRGFRAQFSAP